MGSNVVNDIISRLNHFDLHLFAFLLNLCRNVLIMRRQFVQIRKGESYSGFSLNMKRIVTILGNWDGIDFTNVLTHDPISRLPFMIKGVKDENDRVPFMINCPTTSRLAHENSTFRRLRRRMRLTESISSTSAPTRRVISHHLSFGRAELSRSRNGSANMCPFPSNQVSCVN
jgi:hypothetical protein